MIDEIIDKIKENVFEKTIALKEKLNKIISSNFTNLTNNIWNFLDQYTKNGTLNMNLLESIYTNLDPEGLYPLDTYKNTVVYLEYCK